MGDQRPRVVHTGHVGPARNTCHVGNPMPLQNPGILRPVRRRQNGRLRSGPMAIGTYSGSPGGMNTVVHALEKEGYEVLSRPSMKSASSSHPDLVVGIMSVSGATGRNVAMKVRPIIEALRTQDPPLCVLLAVNDRQAQRITWYHDGDECFAEVGEPIRWRKHNQKTDRYGPWNRGRTVWRIEPGPPCWSVTLDIFQPPDIWQRRLLCGDQVKVEWLDENSPD
jgi:hypothetical protein